MTGAPVAASPSKTSFGLPDLPCGSSGAKKHWGPQLSSVSGGDQGGTTGTRSEPPLPPLPLSAISPGWAPSEIAPPAVALAVPPDDWCCELVVLSCGVAQPLAAATASQAVMQRLSLSAGA